MATSPFVEGGGPVTTGRYDNDTGPLDCDVEFATLVPIDAEALLILETFIVTFCGSGSLNKLNVSFVRNPRSFSTASQKETYLSGIELSFLLDFDCEMRRNLISNGVVVFAKASRSPVKGSSCFT